LCRFRFYNNCVVYNLVEKNIFRHSLKILKVTPKHRGVATCQD
jgi:hypothetical protein